jgi:hypothetical protein
MYRQGMMVQARDERMETLVEGEELLEERLLRREKRNSRRVEVQVAELLSNIPYFNNAVRGNYLYIKLGGFCFWTCHYLCFFLHIHVFLFCSTGVWPRLLGVVRKRERQGGYIIHRPSVWTLRRHV